MNNAEVLVSKSETVNTVVGTPNEVINAKQLADGNFKPVETPTFTQVELVYKIDVLKAHKNSKLESKSFKGAFKLTKLMLESNEESANMLTLLNTVNYGKLKKTTRKSKKGLYSPFFLYQALYKLGKIEAPKKATKKAK